MCARCEAREKDPRRRAFISTGVVEVISQAEIDKIPNLDGSFPGLVPMAQIRVFDDSGRAKFESFTLMRDDKLARVSHHEHIICLN